MLTVSGIADCPFTGTALRPHYLLAYTQVSQVALSAFLTTLYTFLVPISYVIAALIYFVFGFCYYTTILRGNDREAIVSASFLQLADI